MLISWAVIFFFNGSGYGSGEPNWPTSVKELLFSLWVAYLQAAMLAVVINVLLAVLGIDVWEKSSGKAPYESYGAFEDRVR